MRRDWFGFYSIITAMNIGSLDINYLRIYNYRLYGPYTYTPSTHGKYILHKG